MHASYQHSHTMCVYSCCCPAASESGGAISAQQFAHVAISTTTLRSNTAMDGAGVCLKDNASAVLIAGVQLLDNIADKFGGGLAAEGNAQVR